MLVERLMVLDVLASLEENLELWSEAWDAAWSAAWSEARSELWYAARDAALPVARSELWYAARAAAGVTTLAVNRAAARASILALIAYDDCDQFLSMSYEQLQVWAVLSEDPRAILLLPMAYVREQLNEQSMVTSA